MEIYKWVINSLLMVQVPTCYMCYQMWKELKKKDVILELQDKIIESNVEEIRQLKIKAIQNFKL